MPGKSKGTFIGTTVYFLTQMDHKMVQCCCFVNSVGLPSRPDILHSHDGEYFRVNAVQYIINVLFEVLLLKGFCKSLV